MKKIKTWRDFSKNIRPNGCSLLNNINQFPSSVLIAGCQRSGTTVLSRVITRSDDFTEYNITKDDELDAALILSGCEDYNADGRHCFQTTYLNECYTEYFTLNKTHKIVWVIRNPLSVVYSLLYNWSRQPLNNLFKGCALGFLSETEMRRYEVFGDFSVSQLKKSVFSYLAKANQIIELTERLDSTQICVVDYHDIVCNKKDILPLIYEFIDHPYKQKYAELIHSQSINKASKLSEKELLYIKENCIPVYDKITKLAVKI
ncbi:MAG: sulfotransferase domain-containing protein [Pseudomonadota bacterium]